MSLIAFVILISLALSESFSDVAGMAVSVPLSRAENLLLSTISLLEDQVFFEFEEVRVLVRLVFLFIGATGSGGGKRDF
ncbi:hypothetical protein CEXT_699751 [Caerostris extrusa]|uniref:Secreted protein n=1 Tax=Caerostris extrusa TaxID=172846 RepID=A0AAV4M947_CAEEX|nr:hypothetical protein CEXT_699751 [Caerostris extrusa]